VATLRLYHQQPDLGVTPVPGHVRPYQKASPLLDRLRRLVPSPTRSHGWLARAVSFAAPERSAGFCAHHRVGYHLTLGDDTRHRCLRFSSLPDGVPP